METTKKPASDILEVVERVLTAALREVRRARELEPPSGAVLAEQSSRYRRKSVLRICEDILNGLPSPLHVTRLLEELAKRGVKSNRESLVSAITKRRHPNGPFVRTAPNTFGLARRDKGA
jgi:hypothetical protein